MILISSVGFGGWFDSRAGDDRRGEEFLEFLVFLESEIDESWDDSALFLLSGDHNGDFEDFGNEVLEDSGEVDWGSNSDSVSVSSLLEESGDSSDWEGESGLGRSGALSGLGGFSLGFSFSSFGHNVL